MGEEVAPGLFGTRKTGATETQAGRILLGALRPTVFGRHNRTPVRSLGLVLAVCGHLFQWFSPHLDPENHQRIQAVLGICETASTTECQTWLAFRSGTQHHS